MELMTSILMRYFIGTSALNPRAGFLRIFTLAFDSLGYLRVNDNPAGLQPPAGARKRRKASVKKRRNTALGIKPLDPFYFPITTASTLKVQNRVDDTTTRVFNIFSSVLCLFQVRLGQKKSRLPHRGQKQENTCENTLKTRDVITSIKSKL